jgi:hypothetical protein
MPILPTRLRALALAFPLAAALGACTTWSRRPVPAPGEDRFFVGPVRVTPLVASPVVLDSVTVRADSVIGLEHAAPHARVSFPTSQVRLVEARRADPMGTAAVVLASLTAAVALWASFTLGRHGFYE